MYTRNVRSCVSIGIILFYLGLPAEAVARFDSFNINGIEYSIRPMLTTRYLYDDNILLSSTDPSEAWGFSAIASSVMTASVENSSLTLTPRVAVDRFEADENFDSEELFLDYAASRATERNVFELSGVLSRDFTRATEATDTGLVRDLRNRYTISVAPSWTYLISPAFSLRTGFAMSDVEFEEVVGSGLFDYSFLSLNSTLSYQFSEITSFFVSALVTEFDVSESEDFTRSYGGSLGFSTSPWETLEISGSVGFQQSDLVAEVVTPTVVFDPAPRLELVITKDRSEDSGLLWDSRIQKRFDRSILSLDYVRRIQPSTRGSQSENETVTAELAHKLRFNLRGSLNVEYDKQLTQGSSAGTGALDRDSLIFRSTLRWRIRPSWVAQATYRFRWRNSDRAASAASSNALIFSISYQHAPFEYDLAEL